MTCMRDRAWCAGANEDVVCQRKSVATTLRGDIKSNLRHAPAIVDVVNVAGREQNRCAVWDRTGQGSHRYGLVEIGRICIRRH